MKLIQESWKAVAATVVTALITFLTSTGGGLSAGESARSAGLSLLSGLLIYLVPNKEKPLTERAGNVIRDEIGQGLVGLICLIIGVIMIIIGGYNLIASALANVTPNYMLDIILIVVGLILVGVRYYNFDGRSGTRL